MLSRDAALNPRFIIVDYDTDRLGEARWNGGLRGTWTSRGEALRLGASVLSEKGDEDRGNLAALDARLALSEATELRAELGYSESGLADGLAYAAEIEHHSGPVDLLAYVRQVDRGYGVAQQNLAERGRRKFGADARLRIAEEWTLSASAWHDESLIDAAARDAVEVRAGWATRDTEAYVGVAHFDDRLADGVKARSTVLTAGATRRFGSALEITAASSVPLSATESIDLPTRHAVSIRYAVTPQIGLLGTYEHASGIAIDADTVKFGAEFQPWDGGTIGGSLGREMVGSDGPRAADRRCADLRGGHARSAAASRRAAGVRRDDRCEPHGGRRDRAVRSDQSVPSRRQRRPARTVRHARRGFRRRDAGRSLERGAVERSLARRIPRRRNSPIAPGSRRRRSGSSARAAWSEAGSPGPARKLSTAARRKSSTRCFRPPTAPTDSPFALLGKLEYRADSVAGATAGLVGAAGQTALLVTGDAASRRLLASVSGNWAPQRREDGAQRTEIGVFLGARHNFDRFEGFDLAGTTLLGGLDARFGVGERIELGGRATVRHGLDDRTTAFAVGPEIGFVPRANTLVSVGYNLIGFRDPDFREARTTDEGLFLTLRIKFDDDSFGFLGLDR